MNRTEQMHKTYSGGLTAQSAYRKFHKDGEKLAREGWRVQSQAYAYSRLAIPGRHHVVSVVYIREVEKGSEI
jgi:hypothetical protein